MGRLGNGSVGKDILERIEIEGEEGGLKGRNRRSDRINLLKPFAKEGADWKGISQVTRNVWSTLIKVPFGYLD